MISTPENGAERIQGSFGTAMPAHIRAQMRRASDGRVTSRYTRPDGTSTAQCHDGAQAKFFPRHDLIHFAVEDTLHLDHGFFTLLAAGWDIIDMAGKGPRGPLPREHVLAENLVGMFSAELYSKCELTAEELNAQMRAFAAADQVPPLREFSENDLAKVRAEISRWHARWEKVPAGESLEFVFTASNGGEPESTGAISSQSIG